MKIILDITKNYIENFIKIPFNTIFLEKEDIDELFATLLPPIEIPNYNSHIFLEYAKSIEHKIIYSVEDCCKLHWVILKVPLEFTQSQEKIIIFGPFLTTNINDSIIQTILIQNKMPTDFLKIFKSYYNTVQVLSSKEVIFAAEIFLKSILGTQKCIPSIEVFPFKNKNTAHVIRNNSIDEELNTAIMEQVKRRYDLENILLSDVMQGNTPSAMKNYKMLKIESDKLQRGRDPIAIQKNKAIGLNTLLRKAAEQASVHPSYIDILSSSILRKIDAISNLQDLFELKESMIIDYCNLVSKYTVQGYSTLIKKTINYINTHLFTQLTLQLISEAVSVSPNYVSAVFNKETGCSITEYINQKRIQKACTLLTSDTASIEEISTYVGFSDLNYFTRVFKKYTKTTPSEYRKKSKIYTEN